MAGIVADLMIDRVLEPEAMETAAEAREYDQMDHTAVNARFVADMLDAVARIGRRNPDGQFIVDVGTGTARIPIDVCRSQTTCRVVGVDLAHEMLLVARQNVVAAGLSSRIALQLARASDLPFPNASLAAAVSNSLIHHLPNPAAALRELSRVVSPGGVVFVRDLFRPASQTEVDRLVDLYAAGATVHQRQLLWDSLRAALTLDEVRESIKDLPFEKATLEATSDRHWTLRAVRA